VPRRSFQRYGFAIPDRNGQFSPPQAHSFGRAPTRTEANEPPCRFRHPPGGLSSLTSRQRRTKGAVLQMVPSERFR